MENKKSNKGLMFFYILIIGALSWVLWTLLKKYKEKQKEGEISKSDFSHVESFHLNDLTNGDIGFDLDGNYYSFSGQGTFNFKWNKINKPAELPAFSNLYVLGLVHGNIVVFKGFKDFEDIKGFNLKLREK